MFYLDRKLRGVFVPVLDLQTRKLKLFKYKRDVVEYVARFPHAVHRVGRVTVCRN